VVRLASAPAITPGAPKSVVADPGSRSTTWRRSPTRAGYAIPACSGTTAYLGTYAASASRAAASSLPERLQPGQSSAQAKTRCLPTSRKTAVGPPRRAVVAMP
jgi:hypothetical protein